MGAEEIILVGVMEAKVKYHSHCMLFLILNHEAGQETGPGG